MIETSLVKKVLSAMLKSGGDFAEIYLQKKVNNSIKLEDQKIESSIGGFDVGCGLRLWHEGSTYYGYVDSIKKDDLLNAARILASSIGSSNAGSAIKVGEASKSSGRVDKKPSTIALEKKRDMLLAVDGSARNFNQHIIQVASNISDLEQEIFIANSWGHSSYEKSVKVILTVNVVAAKEGEIRTGYKSYAKTLGYEMFGQKSPEDVALQAAGIAVRMLDAMGAPAGEMPVVIGPAFGGVIFHEACGHGLEADAIIKDASVFKGKLGKKVASGLVTAIDDPSLDGHWGSYRFDDESYKSGKTTLIEEGILKSFISDLKSSKKLRSAQTGNGRRQSYRHIPYPRMSNTYIANGSEAPEDIIGSVSRGIYAKEFAGGQVDPATGDFVFGISEGYIIENGEIGEPIKGATLIGNGPNVLQKIEAVGNDLGFAPGFCGKNGQSIANEVGQPTIKVAKMTVGGTEK